MLDETRQTQSNDPLTAIDVPMLLGVDALADHWGVRTSTVRGWARDGQIPAIKIGKSWYFRADRLCEFLS